MLHFVQVLCPCFVPRSPPTIGWRGWLAGIALKQVVKRHKQDKKLRCSNHPVFASPMCISSLRTDCLIPNRTSSALKAKTANFLGSTWSPIENLPNPQTNHKGINSASGIHGDQSCVCLVVEMIGEELRLLEPCLQAMKDIRMLW